MLDGRAMFVHSTCHGLQLPAPKPQSSPPSPISDFKATLAPSRGSVSWPRWGETAPGGGGAWESSVREGKGFAWGEPGELGLFLFWPSVVCSLKAEAPSLSLLPCYKRGLWEGAGV